MAARLLRADPDLAEAWAMAADARMAWSLGAHCTIAAMHCLDLHLGSSSASHARHVALRCSALEEEEWSDDDDADYASFEASLQIFLPATKPDGHRKKSHVPLTCVSTASSPVRKKIAWQCDELSTHRWQQFVWACIPWIL